MKPVIYQVLPRLFGNVNPSCIPGGSYADNGCGKLNDFTSKRLNAIRDMGVTHIWYTGVLDHATQTSFPNDGLPADEPSHVKGQAGSPYAIRDYYNIAPSLAVNVPDRLKEFDNLVRRTHRAGLKVIIDFVPNHVAHRYTGTTQPFTDENFYPGRLCDGDWTDTAKLNYGNRDTWMKMRDILLFWAARHVDGFRCDMAELVPVEFWQWVIPQIKAQHPAILFIAEVYQPWRYRDYIEQGHFDYLYDKVGLYDTLIRLLQGQESATAITHCWQSLGNLTPHMLHFLENHDERRLASDFICGDGRKALPALVVSTCIDTCPFMVYFGQELGERGMEAEGFSGIDGKTTIFDYWSIPTLRQELTDDVAPRKDDKKENSSAGKALSAAPVSTTFVPTGSDKVFTNGDFLPYYYSRLLQLLNSEQALSDGKFFDLMYVNPQSEHFNPHRQYAFLRHADHDLLLVCANFDDQPANVRIHIPEHAFDYLGLPIIVHAQATDLLTGQSISCSLSSFCPVPISLQPRSAAILKFVLP